MAFEHILYEVDGTVATLTLNRPHKRNALGLAIRAEIFTALSAAAQDDAVRVLILTGSGGNFCSGGDIEEMQARKPGADAGRQRMRGNWDWVKALINFDKPVIAAVDGAAAGAGFSVALAADFIIATQRAYFCLSFAKVGLIPDLGGLYLLPRIIGLQAAKELAYSARRVEAAEARELGIVYRVVAPDELLASARSLAVTLGQGSPTATGLTKSILNNAFQSNLDNLLELEASANGICMETAWHKDAIAGFLAKRPPAFAGFER